MSSPLVDAHARQVRYLRLSLTERCNLRCSYCVPADHGELPSDWLSDDEVVGLVAALRPLGLSHVRLTGGEPTLRPRLVQLVRRLAALGPLDLSLTTNGTRLLSLAQPLRDAGLARINLSLDTLDPERFSTIAGGRASLAEVLAGMGAAVDAGFASLKLNTVALRGLNDDELPRLCELAWMHGMVPRFIELMPMADGKVAPREQLLSAAEIRARLTAAFGPLASDEAADLPGVGPARYARFADGRRVGIIAAVTERFCATCNRIRVSARGRLHTCLGIDDAPASASDPLDLRAALARGDVEDVLRAALGQKQEGHTFALDAHALRGGPRRSMIVLGG